MKTTIAAILTVLFVAVKSATAVTLANADTLQINFYRAIVDDNTTAIVSYGERILVSKGETKTLLTQLAKAYKDIKQQDKAISYLKRAYQIDSSDAKTSLLLADVYLAKGMEQQAQLSLLKVLDIDSTNTDALSQLFKIYSANKDFLMAESVAIRLCRFAPNNDPYFYSTGKFYDSNNSPKKALPYYIQAHRLDTTNIRYYLALSKSLIINEAYAKAVETAYKGLQLIPKNETNNTILLKRHIANAYLRLEQNDSCLAHTNMLKSLGDTADSYSYKLAGFANFSKGFFLDASENLQVVYNKSYEMDSSTFDIPYMLGKCYFEINDLSNAEKYIVKAIENILPNNLKLSKTYLDLGLVYKKKKAFGKAIESFTASKNYNPDNYDAYLRLSYIYQYQYNDVNKAKAELNNYLRHVERVLKEDSSKANLFADSYKLVQDLIKNQTVTIFFEIGADGKRRIVEEKRNNSGDVVERKTYLQEEYFNRPQKESR